MRRGRLLLLLALLQVHTLNGFLHPGLQSHHGRYAMSRRVLNEVIPLRHDRQPEDSPSPSADLASETSRRVALEEYPPVLHPCVTCGACCGVFRASFYWAEAEERGLDSDSYEQVSPFMAAFKNTMSPTSDGQGVKVRCCNLEGRIGDKVSCSIYEKRPSCCRDFDASYQDGVTREERCDRARAEFALPALVPESWREWNAHCEALARGGSSEEGGSRAASARVDDVRGVTGGGFLLQRTGTGQRCDVLP
jgi:uncharacterized protein